MRFSAQRLFNKRDGAKLLQVAIPRMKTQYVQGNSSVKIFDGILTGDTSMYAFSAAVPPLNYGFVS